MAKKPPFFKSKGFTEALTLLDTALAYSDKFSRADEGSIGVGPTNVDVFMWLKFLLERVLGRDKVIDIISKFIVYQLPAIEIAVKAVIMVKLNQFSSLCSLRHSLYIPDYLLKDGIRISAKEIDVIGMLHRVPLEVSFTETQKYKMDKYYYFGNEGFSTFDELKNSPDLNSFIWYILNSAEDREIWYGSIKHKTNDKDKSYFNIPKELDDKATIKDESKALFTLVSNDGLNYATADGVMMNGSQRPNTSSEFSFYFGNAIENEYAERERYNNEITSDKKKLSSLYDIIRDIEEKIKQNQYDNSLASKRLEKMTKENGKPSKQSVKDFKEEINKLDAEIAKRNDEIVELTNKLEELKKEGIEQKKAISEKKSEFRKRKRQKTYPHYTTNRYHRKLIQQFNYDYVSSIKLLDEKVIAAQVIEMIFGLKFNINVEGKLSWQQEVIKNEVTKMVKSVIETDEAIVSDCFFSFSNDDYNSLLEETENTLNRGEELNNPSRREAIRDLFSSIDSIGEGTEKSVSQEVISESIKAITNNLEISERIGGKRNKFSATGNIDADFGGLLRDVLQGLCEILVVSILSPKIMLLTVVNKRVIDESSATDFLGWLKSARGLIISIIRKVKDMLIKYLTDVLLEEIKAIMVEIMGLYTIEQIEYYRALIRRLLDCIEFNSESLGFSMDRVNTADIYDKGEPSKKNNC